MKIIITISMLLLMIGNASYGAVSEDMSVYLRKDVYDANMQGMNAKLDMILEQMKLQREEMKDVREELKAQRKDINELAKSVSVLSTRVDGIDKRMDSLDKRIDDLRNGIYLWLVAIGLLIAWPKLYEKFQNWGKSKPSITLEDVKRLIEEQLEKNNAELRKSIQL